MLLSFFYGYGGLVLLESTVFIRETLMMALDDPSCAEESETGTFPSLLLLKSRSCWTHMALENAVIMVLSDSICSLVYSSNFI